MTTHGAKERRPKTGIRIVLHHKARWANVMGKVEKINWMQIAQN